MESKLLLFMWKKYLDEKITLYGFRNEFNSKDASKMSTYPYDITKTSKIVRRIHIHL